MISIFNVLNKKQDELLEFCKEKLKEYKFKKVISNGKWVLGQGNIPILLVAHLDTVHKKLPEIYYDKKKQVLWSPNGIGGDDRCGVYAILKICETYKPYVLFTTDEEVGGKGAENFTKVFKKSKLKDHINFMIEIDRRGYNQAVFYDCGNEEFQKYILSFGFDEQFGSFSDISVLSPALDIASVNLSAGYYNEHTETEYIDLNDLQNTIDKVCEILDDKEHHKYYDYQEVEYEYTNLPSTRYTSYLNSPVPNSVKNDYIELTEGEWEQIYGFRKPNTYNDLIKIYEDMYYGWDNY